MSWWECVGRGVVVSYRTNVHTDTHSCTAPQFCLTEHCSVVVTAGRRELTAFSLAEGRGVHCELSGAQGNFLFDWSRSNSIPTSYSEETVWSWSLSEVPRSWRTVWVLAG